MKIVNSVDKTLLDSEFAQSTNSPSINIEGAVGYSVQAVITNSAPSAKAFAPEDVDTEDDAITETAHGYLTGLKGQFTTDDTLPAGLSLSTDYFIIAIDANTYAVGASLADANADTRVTITDGGTGTHTFTPTSLAGASVKLQASLDNSTFVDIAASSNNITASANFLYNVDAAHYRYFRVAYTLTAGQLDVVTKSIVKVFT